MDIRTTKQSFDFVDPIDIDGRVVYVDLWSLESPCGSSGPLTFVHFKSPDVRTALFFCCVFSDCLTAVLPPLYRTDYRTVFQVLAYEKERCKLAVDGYLSNFGLHL